MPTVVPASRERRNPTPEQTQEPMTDQPTPQTHTDGTAPDENRLIAERRAKLTALRGQGIAFPNDFRRADFVGDLQDAYADAEQWTAEALDGKRHRVAVAGRVL